MADIVSPQKKRKGFIIIDTDRCKGCGLCILECKVHHLISVSLGYNIKGYHAAEFNDLDVKCGGCALCAVVCPDSCIEVLKDDGKSETPEKAPDAEQSTSLDEARDGSFDDAQDRSFENTQDKEVRS